MSAAPQIRTALLDDDGGYVAAGAGKIVTDSLFRTLFGRPSALRECLNRLSYLMYRAKNDCRGACGGQTDVVFLREGSGEQLWINRLDMACAESFGRNMDKALAKSASIVLEEPLFSQPNAYLAFAGELDQLGLAYHRSRFHSRTGEEIA